MPSAADSFQRYARAVENSLGVLAARVNLALLISVIALVVAVAAAAAACH